MNARGLTLVGLLVISACSRSGTVHGDIFVQTQAGDVKRGARISVAVVPSTEAFERDWAATVEAFRADVSPALQAQKAAEHSADQARLAWGQALAARSGAVSRGNRRARYRGFFGQERQRWEEVRAADALLFQAKRRVWEITLQYDLRAGSLLEKYRAQIVQSDETGRYLATGLPVGKAYVYARFVVGSQHLIWFRPVEVRVGAQALDLTGANAGGWPFVI